MPKKPSFEDYLLECVAALGFAGDPTKAENAYTFNLRSAHQAVAAGASLAGIVAKLKELPPQYAPGRPDLLFYPNEVPPDLGVKSKPFRSAVHKLWRRNVLFNKQFPEPPKEGLIEPSNLYYEVEDLIRTRVVCKYMDGPRFVCQELDRYCNARAIRHTYRDVSTDAGYYAWHFYFQSPVEIMLAGEVQTGAMWVELQLSTQLAEVITSLTHGLYEERREGGAGRTSSDWKWDAASQRFRSAYLGHGLHLLEGVIQTFRDDVLRPNPAAPVSAEAATEGDVPSEIPSDRDLGTIPSSEDETQ